MGPGTARWERCAADPRASASARQAYGLQLKRGLETGQTTASYVLDCPSGTVNSMTIRFVATAAKVIFAWPFYATCHAVALANTYQGFRSKAVTFMTFLPALIVTTLIWAGSWTLAFWLFMGIG
jgi:hypothetical protein